MLRGLLKEATLAEKRPQHRQHRGGAQDRHHCSPACAPTYPVSQWCGTREEMTALQTVKRTQAGLRPGGEGASYPVSAATSAYCNVKEGQCRTQGRQATSCSGLRGPVHSITRQVSIKSYYEGVSSPQPKHSRKRLWVNMLSLRARMEIWGKD